MPCPSSTSRTPLLRRVLPIARVVHDRSLPLSLMSMEDLPHEFVLRLCAHIADSSRNLDAWDTAEFSARDEHGGTYHGQVLGACGAAAGIDVGVSFTR
jgi:hypothetical protein